MATGPTAAQLAELEDELRQARVELDEFAQGIHPRALREGGLALALAKLVDRAGLLHVDTDIGRLPAPLEAAIYFVCAEGLTNAAKHAHASNLTVSVSHTTTHADVTVADDGVGAADLSRGSGLRGLTDRIETLGGTLTIESIAGGGTRLHATLPLDCATNP
jgi:signal transduction histidine kinase